MYVHGSPIAHVATTKRTLRIGFPAEYMLLSALCPIYFTTVVKADVLRNLGRQWRCQDLPVYMRVFNARRLPKAAVLINDIHPCRLGLSLESH